MNSEEKLDKIFEKVSEVEIRQARMEGCLHATPCPALTVFQSKHSEEVARLHDKQEEHVKEHHSPNTTRANWELIFNGLCSLATLGALIYMISKGQ